VSWLEVVGSGSRLGRTHEVREKGGDFRVREAAGLLFGRREVAVDKVI